MNTSWEGNDSGGAFCQACNVPPKRCLWMYTSQKLSLGMRNTWFKALGCEVLASIGSAPLKIARFYYSGGAFC